MVDITLSAKERESRPAVIFGALGFGLFGAWGFTVESSTALFGMQAAASLWLWPSSVAYAVVLIVFAFAYRSSARSIPIVALGISCAVVGLAGAGLAAVSVLFPQSFTSVSFLAALLTGIARGVSGLLWLVLFVKLGERDLVKLFGLSMLVTSVMPLVVHACDNAAFSLGVLAILPVASALLLLKCRLLFDSVQNCGCDEASDSAWSFPFKPVAMLVVYTFAVHLATALVPESNFSAAPLGNIVAGLFLFASATLLWSKFQIGFIYRASLPIILASVLLCLLADSSVCAFGVGFFGGIGFSGFLGFVNVVLCVICHRYGISPVWLFGITMAVRVPAKLIAEEVADLALVDPSALSAIVVAAAVALVSFSMACASGRDYESSWGMIPLGDGSNEVETPYKAFLNRCAELSRENSLTHREEEVLTLLAQGMNVPGIERALVISKSTAKSHVRNLYGKLGVHSREELLDKVGREHVLIAERYREKECDGEEDGRRQPF